ncbi:RnfABCDGE type electron transport complex subunit D [Vibrio hippocampi]|uniref:Ion-translocating oxidoreductase complex subunit D n=1 Tax=Vibrio hippocampi TaxID=654686 RepID=A0ABM8ZLV1_9VIBR|nr:RnfABCDGE type electron transport complex subunit D [Vibrio hippocampi]CAH0529345.1 Proton-translocating ferredoxin:NAD(+) oxidoreductase complex subunit D [Vibrio hippocampi]
MINFKPGVGPHAHSHHSSTKIMYLVVLALLPATLFGLISFGPQVARVVAACVVACVVSEALCLLAMGKRISHCFDGSAVLTGLLLAMSLPPAFPTHLCVVGALFAIVVGKQAYGGLGQNLFNPAMLARVFLLVCFPVEMTAWLAPEGLAQVSVADWMQFDAVSSATVLSESRPEVTTRALLTGGQSGSLGETHAIWLLMGGLFLIYQRIITWVIPTFFCVGLLVPAVLGYWIDPEMYLAPSVHLFSGGAILCAFFIATDLVTSPSSAKGQVVYALGCGLLVWLIRSLGSYPEGVAFAVLIMNSLSPLIDYYVQPAWFGSRKLKQGGKAE